LAEIKLENVSHIYPGNVEAVKDVTWTIEDGIAAALLGPSGCGKSTLMKIIAGIIHPTKGRVFIDGNDMTTVPIEKRNIGMVFQFPVVYNMSVFENIAFPLKNRGFSSDEIRKRVKEIAELMGLTNLLNVYAPKLDPGTRQKVALARNIVRGELNALIMDEPLTNIPPEERMMVRLAIKNIRRTFKTTTIFVTHDQSEAFSMSEKVAIMKDGKILQYDRSNEVYERPRNTFIAYFVGHPGMNIIQCSLRNMHVLDFGDFSLSISQSMSQAIVTGCKGNISRIYFGIRPEYVIVDKIERPGWIDFECISTEFGENKLILLLKKETTEIQVSVPRFDIKEGDRVWVNFPEDKIRIFDSDGDLIV